MVVDIYSEIRNGQSKENKDKDKDEDKGFKDKSESKVSQGKSQDCHSQKRICFNYHHCSCGNDINSGNCRTDLMSGWRGVCLL